MLNVKPEALVYNVRITLSIEKDPQYIDPNQVRRIISAKKTKQAETPRRHGEPFVRLYPLEGSSYDETS